MKLSYIIRDRILFLLFFLLTSKSQTDNPSASLLCISECQTCPMICSPPPSPPSPSSPKSPTPTLPKSPPPSLALPSTPPLAHNHQPPPQPYYIELPPPPSSSISTPPPSPPRPSHPPPSTGSSATPPPLVYVYSSPSVMLPPGMQQRNFSYPYYYFYTSKANSLLGLHQVYILFLLFMFFQNVVSF